MHKSCIAASTTRQRAHDPLLPDTHLNRRRTLPRRWPKCGVIGRASPPSKLILVFLGLVRVSAFSQTHVQHWRLEYRRPSSAEETSHRPTIQMKRLTDRGEGMRQTVEAIAGHNHAHEQQGVP